MSGFVDQGIGSNPIGPAGGDLSGTYPSPTVVKLQARSVAATLPMDGQVLTWVNANSDWEPRTPGSGFTAGGDLSGTSTSQTVISISGASPIAITPATLQWITSTASPTLKQADNTTNSATAQALKIQAQNATGTTATGGGLTLTSGTGTTAAGAVLIQTGGTTRLTANATGVITIANLGTGVVHADSSGNLTSSTIVNADVAAAAAITVSKLASGTSAQVLINNATPTPTWTTLTSDVTISATGATTVNSISGASPIAITPANLQYIISTSSPLISQADQTANSTNGQTLTLQSQNATGTTSTGGVLAFKAGTGTTAGGAITFNAAATTTLAEAGRVTAAGAWQFGTNTNQSTSGSLNFQNNTNIAAFRNAANSADVIFLASNNANDLGVGGTLGHANQCRVVQLNGTLAAQAFVSSTQVMNLQISSANDFIALGTSPALSGLLRTSNNTAILNARNAGNTADIQLLLLDSSNNLNFGNGATLPTLIQTGTATVQWVTGVSSPTIKQADNTTNSATAQSLTIQAQNATGTTSTGGGLTLKAGTGTSTNGTVNVVANEFDWDNGATFNVLQTKGNATTTDATTAQTLITYTPTNNSGHSLEITVVGYNTANNNDFAKYQFTLGVVTTSNTPVIVGVNSAINVQTNGAGSTFVGPTVAVSGATITITTKGLAATTIHWVATATRTQVS